MTITEVQRVNEQSVKNAVYAWVLVNHPEVIEDARQMMQPQEPGEDGYHARPDANGGMGSGGYLMNHLTGKSEWVEDIGDYA